VSSNAPEGYGSPLSASDYACLERSYITREVADSALLRRLTSEEGKQIVGRRDREDYAGILFPFIWPGEQRASNHRIRRDSPPFQITRGQRKERDKYLSPPGYGNSLYFHPCTPAGVLSDPTTAFVFTEGEKRALALLRFSYEGDSDSSDAGPAFVPVGLNGVWGWRGKVGTTTNAQGKRVPEKGTISDFSRIEWTGRRVYILFDSNVHTDSMVAAARNGLAQELADRGADVYLIDLPVEDGINGIDDFLGKHGPGPALGLFRSARLFDPKEKLAALHYTDHGNEQAFELIHGSDFLFNRTSKQWLRWDGNIWVNDLTGNVDRAMLDVAAERLAATAKVQDDAREFARTGDIRKNRKNAISAALKLQNVRGRRAALESATSNPTFARRAEDFDQDDYLLGCGNGIIDLRTQEFRPGRREDMLSQRTSVYWAPDAQCPVWLKFLAEVFPDRPALVKFIQIAIGYSLTSLTREEVFFILYGRGRNGKGTFLGTLLAVLGDYACNTEFSTLIVDRDGGKAPRNDIAALAGKRFVAAQESREGAHLDESLIKTLTGGDAITARFLHKEFFTFRPTWKIWLATNHRPKIKGIDQGIWSRPKLIPLTVTFEGREDRGLKSALLQPSELSGILRWAVDGCGKYLTDGICYPEEVVEATSQYKTESDLVGRFLQEQCTTGDGFEVRGRPLYQAFSKWAEQVGEEGMTETAFGLRMKEKPFEKKSSERGNAYVGLRLKDARE
jgi:putative DNA primase/helicase